MGDLWADQGDRISLQYTWAGSIMSTLLREGRKTSYGILEKGCIGLHRAYQASFQDAQRQECIDMFLGLHRTNAGLPCLRGKGCNSDDFGKATGSSAAVAGDYTRLGQDWAVVPECRVDEDPDDEPL